MDKWELLKIGQINPTQRCGMPTWIDGILIEMISTRTSVESYHEISVKIYYMKYPK